MIIVQHPEGDPLKFAIDQQAIIELVHSGLRLRYHTNTVNGSSGSPCFSMDWKLLALHHLGDPSPSELYNKGVPVGLIKGNVGGRRFQRTCRSVGTSMGMTLELTSEEIEALCDAALPFCVEDDLVAALSRYPGTLGPEVCFERPNSLSTLTQVCLKHLELEKSYFRTSFMLRLVEHKWDQEKVRRGAVAKVPRLVRAPRGFEVHVKALSDALNSLLGQIPQAPETIGNETVFRRFCAARGAIESMDTSLTQLEALKAAHDGLQMLQVLGAPAVSPSHPRTDTDASTGPALPLLRRARRIAANLCAAIEFPERIQDVFRQILDPLDDVERKLQSGDPAQIAFATVMLRVIAIRGLSALDIEMFAVWRELNVRVLCSLFQLETTNVDVERAPDGINDLADTTRRRLMEHSFWQAFDVSFFSLQEACSQGSTKLAKTLRDSVPVMTKDLRVLLDSTVAERVNSRLNQAALQYVLDSDPMSGPQNVPRLKALKDFTQS